MDNFIKFLAILILRTFNLNSAQKCMQLPAELCEARFHFIVIRSEVPVVFECGIVLWLSTGKHTFPEVINRWSSALKSQIFRKMESNQNKMVYLVPPNLKG